MNKPVKISCQNVWQLFGSGAKQFLNDHGGAPSQEDIVKAGMIGAVQDVSLDVHEGEILMIMGLSGSGKSTIIRCITRLLEPTAGKVLFDGRDLLQASNAELTEIRRHKMGMVFQHFGLLPQRTVLENIAFPLEIQKVEKHARLAKARELIDVVGLTGREDYYPRELSGGQQQRVGIARSLAVEPDVWFLDEPFSALDPLIRREMQDEFMRLQKMFNKSIAFVTHDFDEAVRLGDRIAIMKDGKVVQIGTPEEVVTAPADDYVSKFVENAPKAKLVSVHRVMGAINGVDRDLQPVNEFDKLEDVVGRVMLSEADIPVAGAGGEIVGSLSKEQVVRALYRSAS